MNLVVVHARDRELALVVDEFVGQYEIVLKSMSSFTGPLHGIAGATILADGSVLTFDEMEISALQEVGNVTIGAFLNEVGRHMDEPVHPTVPVAIADMAGAILDGVLADLTMDSDELLAAHTSFINDGDTIEGAVLVMPQRASLQALTAALGAD